MKCQEISLPPASVLTPDLARCNYVDSYQLSIGRELPLDVAINHCEASASVHRTFGAGE